MASPVLTFRVTRSPARKRMLARMAEGRREVKNAMRQVARDAERAMEQVVSNWKNKPKFVASTFIEPDSTSIYVEPIGPNAKYWEWTSRGTRPHIIRARNKPFLAFREKYEPKTTPGPPPTWGGAGKSSGAYVRKKEVSHPGTTPRNFEEYVGNRMLPEFRRVVHNAMKRGLRKG